MKNSSWGLIAILFGYHLLFTFFAYSFFKDNGGDAAFYWLQNKTSHSKGWFDFFTYGSDFLLFLNYPFVKFLHLDIVFGFLLYSCIGFFGLLQFYRLLRFHIGDRLQFYGVNCLPLVLFLPNQHFWTASLGKEALCFLFIATVLLELSKAKYVSVPIVVSVLFLVVIRPHIALMLLFSVFLGLLLFGKWGFKIKLLFSVIAMGVFSGLFYMFLQLSEIKRFDWERIKRFNEFSLLSFKNSDTYVPIIEYSYPYKIITFYFRPLLNEIPTFSGWVLGLENHLVLVLHSVALVLVFLHYRKLVFPLVFKIILFFALISGLLIVQRYSGFGIFARTKIMMQPFVLVVLLWIIAQITNKSNLQNK